MAHKLFLDMYMFQIKKRYSQNKEPINNNDFLSDAYHDKENKFVDGFVHDIVNKLEDKVYKNKANTHGATLGKIDVSKDERFFDFMLNGGLTGIKQFIIDSETREQTLISKEDVTGMMFFTRIWFPAGSNTGYVFIQKCDSLTIKPVFQSVLNEIFDVHEYNIKGGNIHKLTTIKRQETFLKKSTLKYIYVIGKRNAHDTGGIKAVPAKLRLRSRTLSLSKGLTQEKIREEAKSSGFPMIDDVNYDIRATFEHDITKEEKTAPLGMFDDSLNIVPNILIPSNCINSDNYPIFDEMQKFVSEEIKEIIRESKN